MSRTDQDDGPIIEFGDFREEPEAPSPPKRDVSKPPSQESLRSQFVKTPSPRKRLGWLRWLIVLMVMVLILIGLVIYAIVGREDRIITTERISQPVAEQSRVEAMENRISTLEERVRALEEAERKK